MNNNQSAHSLSINSVQHVCLLRVCRHLLKHHLSLECHLWVRCRGHGIYWIESKRCQIPLKTGQLTHSLKRHDISVTQVHLQCAAATVSSKPLRLCRWLVIQQQEFIGNAIASGVGAFDLAVEIDISDSCSDKLDRKLKSFNNLDDIVPIRG